MPVCRAIPLQPTLAEIMLGLAPWQTTITPFNNSYWLGKLLRATMHSISQPISSNSSSSCSLQLCCSSKHKCRLRLAPQVLFLLYWEMLAGPGHSTGFEDGVLRRVQFRYPSPWAMWAVWVLARRVWESPLQARAWSRWWPPCSTVGTIEHGWDGVCARAWKVASGDCW